MDLRAALDLHRGQNTFDYVDLDTGELTRGRIGGTRIELRDWLAQFPDDATGEFAFEGCTGWRYVAEELAAAGFRAHMAEPADTAALRGKKRRAKTDRADAEHLRRLLCEGRIPESWIPPPFVSDWRSLVRLYKALLDTRKQWIQRGHAQVFHQGAPSVSLTTAHGRAQTVDLDLSDAGHYYLTEAVAMIEHIETRLELLTQRIHQFAREHPGPRACQTLFGIGPLFGTAIWAELGDTRRFSSSDQAVRFTGLDVTVHESDQHRKPGVLARQGSPTLRWALVEAAHHASKKSSPDHDYYQKVRHNQGASRAALSVARKHARRIHHILRDLGDQAWQPIT